jgi:hypothetical protein
MGSITTEHGFTAQASYEPGRGQWVNIGSPTARADYFYNPSGDDRYNHGTYTTVSPFIRQVVFSLLTKTELIQILTRILGQ